MSAKDFFTPNALRDSSNTQQCPVTFKVTSPLFYAQIARCASILVYIKTALSKPDPGAATFHTSRPDLLAKLFEESPSVLNLFAMWPWWKIILSDKHAMALDSPSLAPASSLGRLRWVLVHLFRRLPSRSHPYALSDLDAYAVHLPSTDAPKVRAYRKAALKMLLSDYVAFGMPAVIDAALWTIKIWLCWLCVRSFDGLVGLCNGHRQLTVTEVGKVVIGCMGVHLWWGLGEVL